MVLVLKKADPAEGEEGLEVQEVRKPTRLAKAGGPPSSFE